MALGGKPVWGSATAHGTITSASGVTGTVTQNAPLFPTMTTPPCPSGGYTPAQYVPSGPGISYNAATGVLQRSEEHTSELQSHSDLVCRLLLEKNNARSGSTRRT